MEMVIRPERKRHRRPLLTLVAVVGLALLCGGARIVDQVSLGRAFTSGEYAELAALVLLCAIPVGILGTMTWLNVRNVELRLDNGRLVSTEATGRVVALTHPTSAHLFPVTSYWGGLGELVVIADGESDAAIVLAPSWWRDGDLDSLLADLRLRLRREPAGPYHVIAHRYPKAHLPVSVRRPYLFAGGITALTIAYLWLIVYVVLNFAP